MVGTLLGLDSTKVLATLYTDHGIDTEVSTFVDTDTVKTRLELFQAGTDTPIAIFTGNSLEETLAALIAKCLEGKGKAPQDRLSVL